MKTISVWLFDLDLPAKTRSRIGASLSPDERERAARFIRERDRERFIVARGTLRLVLGAETGRAPADLHFIYNAYGKPALPGDAAPCFSLSHSASLGALGIGYTGPFGLDIERIAPIEPAVAKMSFSPHEQAELAACPPAQWLPSFYRCWSRKEAVIKALGLGLAQPLEDFDVTLAPGAAPRLLRLVGQPDAAERWQLCDLPVGADYMGAVALPESGHTIVVRRWTPD